ncbi:MAG: glutamate--tRNA ligase [Nitrospirae bacterium GWD2_57_9]|nr:MAG: glutamate--tRNA ligase [Nitrospirae bacterium GWD2_57_9]
MSTVRVRFAPSPTGALHIGGVRTALFNWLFARHHKGAFILRIEDTDQARSTDESIRIIINGMKWLGMDWDEGPAVMPDGAVKGYRQTERMDIYREHADRLLKEGKAYYCYCSPEELDTRRKAAMAAGKPPKYDRTCLSRKEPVAGRTPVLRFHSSDEGQTVVRDLIRGAVTFENQQLDDLIIMRSDGFPTYNFAVVVDDITMKISHVVRGDDHLNNTPRQLQIYRALGHEAPEFAHLPMILGSDKTKLSKRHGATAVTEYIDLGYLPEALVNYLARLGWSHGDQEIFSRQELVDQFSLESVGKAPSVFNPDKLLWLNHHYIQQADPGRLAELVLELLKKDGILSGGKEPDREWFRKLVKILTERSHTLVEMKTASLPFLLDTVTLDEKAKAKHLTPDVGPLLAELTARLRQVDPFTHAEIEKEFNQLVAEKGIKLGKIAQPVRVALTGGTVSPGIFEVLEVMGKEKALKRIEFAIAAVK